MTSGFDGGSLECPRLAHNHPLHASQITLLRRHFEVSVDDAAAVTRLAILVCAEIETRSERGERERERGGEREKTYVTARRVPVPEPRAPIRSLATERAPMHAPPKAAAVGMMRLSSLYMLWSRWPAMTRP